jgi:hypothetical protein
VLFVANHPVVTLPPPQSAARAAISIDLIEGLGPPIKWPHPFGDTCPMHLG